jgi:hypothetical protein
VDGADSDTCMHASVRLGTRDSDRLSGRDRAERE